MTTPDKITIKNKMISDDIIKKLKPLSEKSNLECLKALLCNYIIIIFCIAICINVSWFFYPLALIFIGSTQRAFTNLLHEATHSNLAKNKNLNYFAGTLLSGHLVFHMFTPYRESHIKNHHPYLGNEEKDPDYKFHIKCGLYNRTDSIKKFFTENIFMALSGFRSIDYARYVINDRILYRKKIDISPEALLNFKKERFMLSSIWVIILIATVYHQLTPYFIAFWIAPLFTTAIAIGWIIELAEHYPLPESETSQLFLTRNRHGWLIERLILGRHNDNYHLVHHIRPSIPFFNMRKAHNILLEDPAYRTWDGIWGGIFTRSRDGEQTLISYIKAYRSWLAESPHNARKSYASEILKQRCMPRQIYDSAA